MRDAAKGLDCELVYALVSRETTVAAKRKGGGGRTGAIALEPMRCAATGELRLNGLRVKGNARPLQVLLMLLGRPSVPFCLNPHLSKIGVEVERRDCHRTASLVIAGVVHVLKVVGDRESAPQVRRVKALDDLFLAVGERAVA